ncbi:MAG: enoyl-CoA hydratase/isomerase family protein [Gammaproteobacteria bacterium]
MTSELLFDVDNNVGTITLNRPELMNAFGDNTRTSLLEILIAAETNDEVGCVVITGAGKAFAAGGDINSMRAQQDNDDSATITARMATAGEVVTLIRRMRKPVIAAVNGAAAGGGVNLALACDLRYASSKAILVQSFVKIGLMPDWGGHYLLPRLVGTAKALELCMLGERIDANKALELGLLNDVFPADEFAERVREIALKLANSPRDTLAAIKHCTYFSGHNTFEDTLRKEQAMQAELFLSDNAKEGMRAFIDKRTPRFNQ